MPVARWGSRFAFPRTIVTALDLKPSEEIEIRIASDRVFEISRDNQRQAALAKVWRLRKPLPERFRFDRDEAK